MDKNWDRDGNKFSGSIGALGKLQLPTTADDDRDRASDDALARAANDAILQRDRAVLRQLVAAAKESRYQRAFDLARRLETPDSLDLALRIAESHGEAALSSRVEDLVAFREALLAAAPEEDDEPAAAAPAAPADDVENDPPAPLDRRSSNEPSPDKPPPAAKAPPSPIPPADFNPFKVKKAPVSTIDALRFN